MVRSGHTLGPLGRRTYAVESGRFDLISKFVHVILSVIVTFPRSVKAVSESQNSDSDVFFFHEVTLGRTEFPSKDKRL